MIKAVLFDMDGVLYNSMPGHARAWHEILSEIGITAPLNDFYLHEGRTGRETIQIYFKPFFGREATDEECQALCARKSQRFSELNARPRPMPGALDVLRRVKTLGLQCILVTGSGQYSLLKELDSHFPGYFSKERMVTAFDVQHGKPHPEPYLQGLKKGKLRAEEAIVIENAPLGVESACAAAIYTIAVNTGPLPDRLLWDAGANRVYPSMRVLSENIEQLVSNPHWRRRD